MATFEDPITTPKTGKGILNRPTQLAQSKMLRIIRRKFPVEVWKPGSSFETLIHTILSQNTNDRTSYTAMRRLRKQYEITPRVLAKAKVSDIINCIRSAGLYRSKAPRIIEVSKIIEQRYKGRLSAILNLPYDQAKAILTSLPGVGPKTADILLAFVAKRPVIPVDTHIARVSKRLGIAPPNSDYERIRRNLESLVPARDRLELHLSLIAFGRTTCRAPEPQCAICPVSDLCPSSNV